MTTIHYALNDQDATSEGVKLAQKPHHNQEKCHANDELEFVGFYGSRFEFSGNGVQGRSTFWG